MAELSPKISIITLNVNALLHKLKCRDQQSRLKINSSICCLQEIHFKYNDIDRLKQKRVENTCVNINQRTGGATTVITEQTSEQRKSETEGNVT